MFYLMTIWIFLSENIVHKEDGELKGRFWVQLSRRENKLRILCWKISLFSWEVFKQNTEKYFLPSSSKLCDIWSGTLLLNLHHKLEG